MRQLTSGLAMVALIALAFLTLIHPGFIVTPGVQAWTIPIVAIVIAVIVLASTIDAHFRAYEDIVRGILRYLLIALKRKGPPEL